MSKQAGATGRPFETSLWAPGGPPSAENKSIRRAEGIQWCRSDDAGVVQEGGGGREQHDINKSYNPYLRSGD